MLDLLIHGKRFQMLLPPSSHTRFMGYNAADIQGFSVSPKREDDILRGKCGQIILDTAT